MDVSVDISQYAVLQNFFNTLSSVDQKKIFIAGYRRAAKPLINEAKRVVPRKTGRLQKSIGSVEKPEEVAIIVGAKLSGANRGWYGHFSEEGTKDRYRKAERKIKRGFYKGLVRGRKSGTGATGRVVGTHWFERAYMATEQQVFDNIADEWYKAIDMAITRINRRAKK